MQRWAATTVPLRNRVCECSSESPVASTAPLFQIYNWLVCMQLQSSGLVFLCWCGGGWVKGGGGGGGGDEWQELCSSSPKD